MPRLQKSMFGWKNPTIQHHHNNSHQLKKTVHKTKIWKKNPHLDLRPPRSRPALRPVPLPTATPPTPALRPLPPRLTANIYFSFNKLSGSYKTRSLAKNQLKENHCTVWIQLLTVCQIVPKSDFQSELSMKHFIFQIMLKSCCQLHSQSTLFSFEYVDFWPIILLVIKFIYSEKATNFCVISTVDLSYV